MSTHSSISRMRTKCHIRGRKKNEYVRLRSWVQGFESIRLEPRNYGYRSNGRSQTTRQVRCSYVVGETRIKFVVPDVCLFAFGVRVGFQHRVRSKCRGRRLEFSQPKPNTSTTLGRTWAPSIVHHRLVSFVVRDVVSIPSFPHPRHANLRPFLRRITALRHLFVGSLVLRQMVEKKKVTWTRDTTLGKHLLPRFVAAASRLVSG